MTGRRGFLAGSAALVAAAGCGPARWPGVEVRVSRPGMREGHRIRDNGTLPPPAEELTTDVAIVGSGVAGLTAAWKLAREGHRGFVLLSGPEFGGNASGARAGDLRYPRGAHYLPLPSRESVHVREILAALGILDGAPGDERPAYDETALLHAPDERILVGDSWREGLLPISDDPRERAESARFFAFVATLKSQRGKDGRKAFAVPLALSSADPTWTALDAVSFDAWLDAAGFRAPSLRWYLDYCCRDDYGVGSNRASAWAGLHYFAARAGHARNAPDGAVLTWPDGLAHLIRGMTGSIVRDTGRTGVIRSGFATCLRAGGDGVTVDCVGPGRDDAPRTFRIRARRAVCAVPLHVATRIVPDIAGYGFDAARHLPRSAPWIVANVLLDGFPPERQGAPLAWDNVVAGSTGLGYVVATHQVIGAARPPRTVFTAYRAVTDDDAHAARARLARMDDTALYDEAVGDLRRAYGWRIALRMRAADITVRGHAMASPTPGFLGNAGLRALREVDGPISFAHSDLSGLSLFEEASWWGWQAALRILGGR
jgi:NAD(P)-binding Rossmann-like domain